MTENTIETEESIVPIVIATVAVTVGAIMAVKGLRAFVDVIRKGNAIKKAAHAEVLTEETN